MFVFCDDMQTWGFGLVPKIILGIGAAFMLGSAVLLLTLVVRACSGYR